MPDEEETPAGGEATAQEAPAQEPAAGGSPDAAALEDSDDGDGGAAAPEQPAEAPAKDEAAEDDAGDAAGDDDAVAALEDDDEGGEPAGDDAAAEDAEAERKRRKREKKERRKRRRKKKRAESEEPEEGEGEADEDDLLLLQDAGVQVRKKGLKRLKRAGGDADEEEGLVGRTAEEVERELFGAGGLEDEDAEGERAAGEGAGGDAQPVGADEDFDEEGDDMGGFIEHDIDGLKVEHEAARKARERIRGNASLQGVDEEALADAQDIFGGADEMLMEFEAAQRQQAEAEAMEAAALEDAVGGGAAALYGDEGLEGFIEDDEGGDPEAAAARRAEDKKKKREAALKRARERIDPETMKRLYLTDQDEAVRQSNMPERMHERPLPELPAGMGAKDAAVAASWWVNDWLCHLPESDPVLRTLKRGVREVEFKDFARGELEGGVCDLGTRRGLFTPKEDYKQEKFLRDNKLPASDPKRGVLQEDVFHTIELLWGHREVGTEPVPLEPPTIGMYRKELAGELINLREGDEPSWTTFREENDRRNKGQPEYVEGTIQAHHRRLRRWDVLYAVEEAARRWRALEALRARGAEAYRRAAEAAADPDGDDARRLRECHSLLEMVAGAPESGELRRSWGVALSQAVIDDVQLKASAVMRASDDVGLSMHATGLDGDDGGGDAGRVKRSSQYKVLRDSGAAPLARRLILTPHQLAENLEAGVNLHYTPTPFCGLDDLVADEAAQPQAVLRDTDNLLKAARRLAAHELGMEPALLQDVRRLVHSFGLLSTHPTDEGESRIDAFHLLGPVKRISKKPLSRVDGATMALAVHAEQQGLIRIEIELSRGLPEDEETKKKMTIEEAVPDIDPSLYGDKEYCAIIETDAQERAIAEMEAAAAPREDEMRELGEEAAEEYANQRRAILTDALEQHLLPRAVAQVRARLLEQSHAHIAQCVGDAAWELATAPPLEIVGKEDERVAQIKLLVLTWGDGNPELTTGAVVDYRGNLVDHATFPRLSGRVPRTRGLDRAALLMDARKGRDCEALLSMIRVHQPHAVLLGASSFACATLQEDVSNLLQYLLLTYPTEMNAEVDGVPELRLVDEGIARVWCESEAGVTEFPEHSAAVRRAVALARCATDQLAVVCSLAGRSGASELLSLDLHPAQNVAAADDRALAIERALVSAVAQVGVVINALSTFPWRRATLRFLPGLGPRKARALLQAIAGRGGFVHSRRELLELLGKHRAVFWNCSASVRITPADGEDGTLHTVLDSTRVHPEAYSLAKWVVQQAVQWEREAGDGAGGGARRGGARKARRRGSGSGSGSEGGDASDEDAGSEEDPEDDPESVLEHMLDRVGGKERAERIDMRRMADLIDDMCMLGERPCLHPLFPPESLEEKEKKKHPDVKGPSLVDIQQELVAPFGALWKPYQPMSDTDGYLKMAGLTAADLQRGKRVAGRLTSVQRKVFIAVLDSGIEARVDPEKFASRLATDEVTRRIEEEPEGLRSVAEEMGIVPGVAINGRVLDGMLPKLRAAEQAEQMDGDMMMDANGGRMYSPGQQPFDVRLTCLTADLMQEDRYEREVMHSRPATHDMSRAPRAGEQRGALEPFFRVVDATQRARERGRKAAARQQQFVPRPIAHPQFKNLSVDAANEVAMGLSQGECLFRPSTAKAETGAGTDRLVCMVKLYGGPGEGVVCSVPIIERRSVPGGVKEKARGDLTLGDALSVEYHGRPLGTNFEDLDEVVASFVSPMCDGATQVVDSRKFFEGSESEAKEHLQLVLRASSSAKAGDYVVGVSRRQEGWFYLAMGVMKNGTVGTAFEYFEWVPKALTSSKDRVGEGGGFRFRKAVHRSVESVVNAFKQDPFKAKEKKPAPPAAAMLANRYPGQQAAGDMGAPRAAGVGGFVPARAPASFLPGQGVAPPPPPTAAVARRPHAGAPGPPPPPPPGGDYYQGGYYQEPPPPTSA
ncbi:unnamed protein product [Pedinophyceae sp. YPF-701]|nr:unnamed protein product [Pedinophyceae sp. YPF-701]